MLPSRKARLFDSEMYLIFVILFLVEFIRGAALISFLPIYGEKMLGLPLGIIGIGITAHYLTDTLLKIAIGYLLDRFSIRFIVHASLLLSVAGVILIPFAAQPWLFITASALFGIGISPIWIVCLTKVDESRRATQMGFLYTIWFVGLGAGPIVCNFAIHRGMEHAYELLFVCTALAWFLSLFTSNRRMADIVTLPLSEQMRVLKDKLSRMKLLLPGMVLQTTGAAMLVPILPRFAEIRLGLTPPQYSLLLTAGGLCTVAALVPMGRLSDKVGNKKWFLVGGFSFLPWRCTDLPGDRICGRRCSSPPCSAFRTPLCCPLGTRCSLPMFRRSSEDSAGAFFHRGRDRRHDRSRSGRLFGVLARRSVRRLDQRRIVRPNRAVLFMVSVPRFRREWRL
ncbi:hypothetical protein PACILC2_01560 [Paenibacillus cisolokensis]|uniref:Major facilitator superfamily (MFS) profile domain-containing protein n=1 Tax=Paenibacillus cisolokensis TaxID=1658519 RepID=A0ABQ4N093_9BACL|nr:MFS transporter [Paenibacillus cisolokensis]GIQ61588.1 hypothetical protein PACILC2_01560 [Paenibacillus cisolokensis]